jgi:hypothetical protein
MLRDQTAATTASQPLAPSELVPSVNHLDHASARDLLVNSGSANKPAARAATVDEEMAGRLDGSAAVA